MILRFCIWRSRRRARILSWHSRLTIEARYSGIHVGSFRNGREVTR